MKKVVKIAECLQNLKPLHFEQYRVLAREPEPLPLPIPNRAPESHPFPAHPEPYRCEESWLMARRELLKMGQYKAPRDKLVCVLNCCRVINNLLHLGSSGSGDAKGGLFLSLGCCIEAAK